MKKKLLKILIVTLSAFSLFSAACNSQKGMNDTSKVTIFDRAKELSQYYDVVPGSLAEMVGTDENMNADSSVVNYRLASQLTRGSNLMYEPSLRPKPVPDWLVDDCKYSQNSVDMMISNVKEFADSAKNFFQTPTRLNCWYGNNGNAIRLNYDNQLDKISQEHFMRNTYKTDLGQSYSINYDITQLNLGKNHKTHYSYASYYKNITDYDDSIDYGGFYCEYVEDDYYYYVANTGTSKAISSIVYLDLKTSPVQIYSVDWAVPDSDSEGRVQFLKSVNLELSDGRKVSCISRDNGAFQKYLYNRDNYLILKDGITIDLWQTTGWESLELSDYLNYDYVLKTDRELAGSWNKPLYEGENFFIYLDAKYSGDLSDNNVLITLDFTVGDKSLATYENLQKMLAEIGLSFKEDLSELYNENFDPFSNDEALLKYTSNKFDFGAMNQESFIDIMEGLNIESNLKTAIAEFENTHVYNESEVRNPNVVNEAYSMLNSSMSGEVKVLFDDFNLDLSSLKFEIPDSVLHVYGESYGVKVGLYNGKSFIELSSAKKPYENSDIEINFDGKVSLIKNIDYNSDFILVAYVCNSEGARCSELFYLDAVEDGKEVMSVGGDNYLLSINNKTLSLCRKQKSHKN